MSAAPAAEVHRDPGGPPAILTEAVDDAQLLLAYAAEHGKGIDVEATRIIIGSRRLRDGGATKTAPRWPSGWRSTSWRGLWPRSRS
ncbi:MAG: hypothetical protein HYY95_12120 [Candidatus Rokubacteria bacterium]|nr:hypothetical protein [Candidatus Rokubacteria bacterium]